MVFVGFRKFVVKAWFEMSKVSFTKLRRLSYKSFALCDVRLRPGVFRFSLYGFLAASPGASTLNHQPAVSPND